MRVSKKISRYILFFVAIAFLLVPKESEPDPDHVITSGEIIFYTVYIGCISSARNRQKAF